MSSPFVRPWKDFSNPPGASYENGYPDSWPGWVSPDVFVDNTGSRVQQTATGPHTTGPFTYWSNVDEPGEPALGKSDNQLFIAIWGPLNATTELSVSFSPYAMVGGVWTKFHFEQIVPPFMVTLTTVPLLVEVPWDLSNLSDTNGGLWSQPLGSFNHFCVNVSLSPGTGTQSNFGNVTSMSPFRVVPLLVANSDPEPRTYEMVAQQLPEKWALHLRGAGSLRDDKDRSASSARREVRIARDEKVKITLEPGEERFITLAIARPEGKLNGSELVTLGLIADGKLVGGVTLNAGPGAPPTGQPTRPKCLPPIRTYSPLPVFFPRKEIILKTPIQLATAGTTLVRVAKEQNK